MTAIFTFLEHREELMMDFMQAPTQQLYGQGFPEQE